MQTNLQSWSADFSKTTAGKSLGNLRAMHGHIAAGKLTAIDFSDEKKSIEIAAKVVDDGEWNKVLEGVYTGFSQGGKYVRPGELDIEGGSLGAFARADAVFEA